MKSNFKFYSTCARTSNYPTWYHANCVVFDSLDVRMSSGGQKLGEALERDATPRDRVSLYHRRRFVRFCDCVLCPWFLLVMPCYSTATKNDSI